MLACGLKRRAGTVPRSAGSQCKLKRYCAKGCACIQHIHLAYSIYSVYYISSLPTSEETKSVTLKGHQTNTRNAQQKRKLQLQLLFTITASSKYADDSLPSLYILDICCDSRWMNISKSQAVVLLLLPR